MEQHVDAGRLQIRIKLLGNGFDLLRLVHTDGCDRALEGRDGHWPHDAFVIMVLFDGGGHDT